MSSPNFIINQELSLVFLTDLCTPWSYSPMVGEGVEVRELPKLPLLINPVEGNPLVRPDVEDPPFSASISLVNSCLQKLHTLYIV